MSEYLRSMGAVLQPGDPGYDPKVPDYDPAAAINFTVDETGQTTAKPGTPAKAGMLGNISFTMLAIVGAGAYFLLSGKKRGGGRVRRSGRTRARRSRRTRRGRR